MLALLAWLSPLTCGVPPSWGSARVRAAAKACPLQHARRATPRGAPAQLPVLALRWEQQRFNPISTRRAARYARVTRADAVRAGQVCRRAAPRGDDEPLCQDLRHVHRVHAVRARLPHGRPRDGAVERMPRGPDCVRAPHRGLCVCVSQDIFFTLMTLLGTAL